MRPAVTDGNVTYTYDHPLGLMTRKTYGGMILNYTYDKDGLLKVLTDNTRTLTYVERNPRGQPVAATLSGGGEDIALTWGYDAWHYPATMAYTKGQELLAGFSAINDRFGNRRSTATPEGSGDAATGFSGDSAPLWRIVDRVLRITEKAYIRVLSLALRNKKKVLFLTVCVLVFSAGLLPLMGREFIPEVDQGNFVIKLTADAGASLA